MKEPGIKIKPQNYLKSEPNMSDYNWRTKIQVIQDSSFQCGNGQMKFLQKLKQINKLKKTINQVTFRYICGNIQEVSLSKAGNLCYRPLIVGRSQVSTGYILKDLPNSHKDIMSGTKEGKMAIKIVKDNPRLFGSGFDIFQVVHDLQVQQTF